MIAKLLRDPIVRIALLLWAATAAVYFVPGVSAAFLERLGDRYSTLPLWPWAAAGCVYRLEQLTKIEDRRFWLLQGASFAALLAIEVPWAFNQAGETPGWNVATEWCYALFYLGQMSSAARTRKGAVRAGAAPLAAAGVLSVLAITHGAGYDSGIPSYLTYLVLDVVMAAMFWRAQAAASAAWRPVFVGLAVVSALVLVTDALDMCSYENWIYMPSGMKTDILWTLPPLCYALVARLGRQRLETPA